MRRFFFGLVYVCELEGVKSIKDWCQYVGMYFRTNLENYLYRFKPLVAILAKNTIFYNQMYNLQIAIAAWCYMTCWLL